MQDYPMRKLIWKDIELINQLAEKNGYNRQVDIDVLKKYVKNHVKSKGYEDFESVYFPAQEYMVHTHKSGEKCEPHMRIGIWFPDDIHIILDCDVDLWNSFERTSTSFPYSSNKVEIEDLQRLLI